MTLKSRLAAYRAIQERERQIVEEIKAQQAKVRNGKYIISKDNPFDPNHKDTLISVSDKLVASNPEYLDYREVPLTFCTIGGLASLKYDTKGDTTIQYSFDNENWYDYVSNTMLSMDFQKRIYFRGSLTKAETHFTILGGNIKISGNLMSLLVPTDFQFKQNINMDGQFKGLFKECRTVSDIQDMFITATKLTKNCYAQMFMNCKSLMNVNSELLPATELTDSCYEQMFAGSGIINAPIVVAGGTDVVAPFKQMFQDCTELTNVDNMILTSQIGFQNCFEQTFSGCKKLVFVNPNMFSYIQKPDRNCFYRTFEECVSLEKAPAFTVDTIYPGSTSFGGTFVGCTSLNEIWIEDLVLTPEMRPEFADWCINVAPKGTFHAHPEAQWADGPSGNPWPVVIFTIDKINTPGRGSVEGPDTAEEGELVTFTAIPEHNYHFVRWEDGTIKNPREKRILVDHTRIEPFFAPDTMPIKVEVDKARGEYIGPYNADYASTITMAISPRYGYEFTRWSDGVVDNPREMYVGGPIAIGATLSPLRYNITVRYDGTQGYVSGPTSALYKSVVEHRANPTVGYKFKNWSDGYAGNPHTMIVERDVVLVAEFEKVLLPITINYDDLMGTVSGPKEAYIGDTIKLEAKPLENYAFDHWEDGSTNPVRLLEVTGPMVVEAVFSKIPATIEIIYDPTMGLVEGPTEGFLGDYLEYTATAIPPYEFTGWADGSLINPRVLYIDKTEMTLEAKFE